MTTIGCVYLVGAGPGDPELLTLKARRLLDEADVVVYDRLVSDEIMALVPAGTARISVGKQPRCHPVPQQEINELLVRLADSGRTVVRLKGGDPFLFGRGSEEAAHLRAHGVPFAVVAGVTSASACAAAVGIPLTHRGLASGVHFVTGHCRDDGDLDLNWDALAEPDTTLVIYMGMANIPQIAVLLISHGLAATTPAAAIANGSRRNQRHVISTLGEIGAAAASADFDGPVLFIIGRVVDMAATLTGEDVPSNRPRLAEARRRV